MKLHRFNRIYKYGLFYGLSQATYLLLHNKSSKLCSIILFLKKKAVLSFIYKNYDDIINKYRVINVKQYPIKSSDNIWIFWNRGVNMMPDIVRSCFNSVLQNAGGRNVQLLTDDNIELFLKIPFHILEKKKQGLISIQHFSDYVRMAIVYKYGGIWLDATVLLTSPIDIDQNSSFISIKNYDLKYVPNNGKWNIFFIGGGKGNPIFSFIADIISEYWRTHNDIIDYFFTDYCINIAYNEMDWFKHMVDILPNIQSEYDVHSLLLRRNMVIDERVYFEIVDNIHIHKLQYKATYLNVTSGKLSFAGYIVDKYK